MSLKQTTELTLKGISELMRRLRRFFAAHFSEVSIEVQISKFIFKCERGYMKTIEVEEPSMLMMDKIKIKRFES